MSDVAAFATHGADQALGPHRIQRRAPGPHEVAIEIRYCGVCHSDLHTARNEWGNTHYPCVPGHEIVGRVTAAGAAVQRFAVGDSVGVGCMVDSCRECGPCRAGDENYCENGFTATYNSRVEGGDHTLGGYAAAIVVHEDFVLRIRHQDKLAAVAPLLCAGITTYSPLRHWRVGRGDKVGIVGLGGLGHMGVKLAHAMGAHVVLFTTSPDKVADGKRLGADEVVISSDAAQMRQQRGRLNFILDTVAAPHSLDDYVKLLEHDGSLCLVGMPGEPHPSPQVAQLILKRRSLSGSLIGGIRETQEMLDFCAEHELVCDIEMIAMAEVNSAYERMLRSDVKYRFVIDMATLTG